MRLALMTTALLLATSVAPAVAQDADEAWCAGFLDYLSVETDVMLPVETTAHLHDGCVAYLRVAGAPGMDANAAGQESVVISDAQRIWCSEHDINANHGGADHDDYDLVAEAAQSLDIPIPQPLLDYNNAFWFASHLDWAELIPEDIVSAYFDWDMSGGRSEWRDSDGYARACNAAYELGR